jgi:hypothetical protein
MEKVQFSGKKRKKRKKLAAIILPLEKKLYICNPKFYLLTNAIIINILKYK